MDNDGFIGWYKFESEFFNYQIQILIDAVSL